MCGVVAIWSPAGGLHPAELTAAVRAVRHRGPDAEGTWVSPSGRAALGHTRLAIIDLETGDQPIGDRDGRYHLAAVGEFYGYRQIRDELRQAGCPLRTHSDSEIALHLYAKEGSAALHRLRGEFAFLIWDELRGELFAARDRFGIKPLYYAEHGGRLYLASEVKALLACGLPAAWDAEAFADHLLVGHAADRTLFAGVRQVPPGCYLLAGADGVAVRRYWDLDYPTADELPAETGHLDDVLAALREAVQVRTHADVPVAYHLSGGVDSSSVVALAAETGADLPTFTVRFDDGGFDEGARARRTATMFGARHTEIFVGREELVGRIDDVAFAGEMIQENSHGIARLMQSEAIHAHGYKAVLAGEGGDEMFLGYPQFAKDLAYSLSGQVRERAATSYARLGSSGLPGQLAALVERLGFVPNWILDRYLNVTLPLLPLLDGDFARLLMARIPCAGLLDQRHDQLRGRAPLHQSMYLFFKTWLCNYILAAERLDMRHALEVRLPFLDHHVLDVAKRTPLAAYARGGVLKSVLRDAMRRHLPPEVLLGAKQGFFAPPAVANDAALGRLREIVAGDMLEEVPFFDTARTRGLLDRVAAEPGARRGGHERITQIVAGTCLLTRAFRMAPAADPRGAG